MTCVDTNCLSWRWPGSHNFVTLKLMLRQEPICTRIEGNSCNQGNLTCSIIPTDFDKYILRCIQ